MDQSITSASSVASLRRSKAASDISRAYKQASAQYLTRRLPEALSTIQGIIAIPPENPYQQRDEDSSYADMPLIANANRKYRVKVWSLYITLLNAIAELGPEEGSEIFGSKEWKRLVGKAKDGSIWDEVVSTGYGGIESNVDADVVANLANLLLAQSENQALNQSHIETYLSSSGTVDTDVNDHTNSSSQLDLSENSRAVQKDKPDILHELELKVQIIELYALHVLPRNGEWDYAKEFIELSDLLDEEVKEAFLHNLKSLEETVHDTKPLKQLEPMHEPEKVQDTPMKNVESSDSVSTVKQKTPSIHRKSESPQDYGIDDSILPARPQTHKTVTPNPGLMRKEPSKPRPRPSRSAQGVPSQRPMQASLYKRSVAMLFMIQHLVSHMSSHLSQNPMAMLRFILFLMGLITAFTRRDVKDRLGAGWEKVRRTIGMGVKVSYI